MKWLLCLIPILCGCSTADIRCDSHLSPINVPTSGIGPGAPAVSADPRSIH